jgi:hypothetical protein
MRKKSLLFLLTFTLAAVGAFSQNLVHKVEFGFSGQPQLGNLVFKEENYYSSEPRFSYGISADIFYRLGSRLQLHSGLEWQSAHLNFRNGNLQFPDDQMNGVWVPGRSYYDFNYTYQFLGVPLGMIYQVGSTEKENHFFLEGGLKFRNKISTSGKAQLTESGFQHPEEEIDEQLFPETPGTWVYGNLGFGYLQKAGHFSIRYSPTFEYSFSQLNNENGFVWAISGHPIFFGLSIGVSGI